MSFVRKNNDDKKPTFGVIVGNRDVFPDNLAKEGRLEIIEILTELGYDYIISSENDTKYGVVETFSDAKKCADLFKRNRDKIIGILVILPNFGDEKGIANAIKLSELDVPILIYDLRKFVKLLGKLGGLGSDRSALDLMHLKP